MLVLGETIRNIMAIGTYRGIDGTIALEVGVLVQTVVGLAEGHARSAAGDEAGVDGLAAVKGAVLPLTRAGGGGDGGGILGRGGGPVHPVVNV